MIGRALLVLLSLAAARDDPLAGRVAGKPAECIDLDRVQAPEIVDARTILYRQNGRRIWRTGPRDTCAAMRPGDGLIVSIFGRKVCRNDRFRVRTTGTVLGGECRFGPFVPYDKVVSSKR